jgi:uncharacterized protein (DUF3084 family)
MFNLKNDTMKKVILASALAFFFLAAQVSFAQTTDAKKDTKQEPKTEKKEVKKEKKDKKAVKKDKKAVKKEKKEAPAAK